METIQWYLLQNTTTFLCNNGNPESCSYMGRFCAQQFHVSRWQPNITVSQHVLRRGELLEKEKNSLLYYSNWSCFMCFAGKCSTVLIFALAKESFMEMVMKSARQPFHQALCMPYWKCLPLRYFFYRFHGKLQHIQEGWSNSPVHRPRKCYSGPASAVWFLSSNGVLSCQVIYIFIYLFILFI